MLYTPMVEPTRQEELNKLLKECGNEHWQTHVNPVVKDLVARMVLSNPDHRPTAQEILDHPWVKGQDLFLISTDTEQDNSPKTTSIAPTESPDNGK